MSRTPATPEEDELDELPPLDGEVDDSSEADETVDELDEDSSKTSLDDSTAESDTPDASELALDDDEKSWLDEPADAPDLDVGDIALIVLKDEGFVQDDADEPAPGDEDVGLIDTSARGGLDAGDEGPLDADEELRDEDLPALDADDEGELADAGFVDDRFAADEPLGLPWAAVPWTRVGAPLGTFRGTAIACAGRGALVASEVESGGERTELVQVDLEGARSAVVAEGLEGEIQSLAAGGSDKALAVVVLRGGRVLVSVDGGLHFEMRGPTAPIADAVIAADTIWLRTRSGGLLALRDGGRALTRCPVTGTVAALASDRADVLALVVNEDRRPVAILRGGVEGLVVREPFDAPEVRASALLAARNGYFAYPGRSGVVRRGPDGVGQSFAWQGRVTALAFVDDSGTLLAATYSDADDTTGLVRLDSAGGAAIVARIGALRDGLRADGRALGMACDDAHGVVWLTGGFGVAAFAIATE